MQSSVDVPQNATHLSNKTSFHTCRCRSRVRNEHIRILASSSHPLCATVDELFDINRVVELIKIPKKYSPCTLELPTAEGWFRFFGTSPNSPLCRGIAGWAPVPLLKLFYKPCYGLGIIKFLLKILLKLKKPMVVESSRGQYFTQLTLSLCGLSQSRTSFYSREWDN